MFSYFYSDPHFGHRRICDYTERPFLSSEEHDRALIERYNATVEPWDHVLWTGDCFFGPKHRAAEVMRELRGLKSLVLGNHDEWSPATYSALGFGVVTAPSRWPSGRSGRWPMRGRGPSSGLRGQQSTGGNHLIMAAAEACVAHGQRRPPSP